MDPVPENIPTVNITKDIAQQCLILAEIANSAAGFKQVAPNGPLVAAVALNVLEHLSKELNK